MGIQWPWRKSAKDLWLDPQTPFAEQEFWVIDGEMSGLDPQKNELLSLAIIPIRDLKIQLHDFRYWLIQPEREQLELDNIKIHGLTPKALISAKSKIEVAEECRTFFEQRLIVGHCVGIDWEFLKPFFQHYSSGHVPEPQFIDTLQLCQWLSKKNDPHDLQNDERFQLADCCRKYGTPLWPEHHAANDVLSCASLFLKLLHLISGKGYHKLGDLMRLK